jgi:hypothetical protein
METAAHDEGPVISMVLQLAGVLAAQVAFAVVRTRKEQQFGEARTITFHDRSRSDGHLGSGPVDGLRSVVGHLTRIHGLPEGGFDGTFATYVREIRLDEPARAHASSMRSLNDGVPHDVE